MSQGGRLKDSATAAALAEAPPPHGGDEGAGGRRWRVRYAGARAPAFLAARSSSQTVIGAAMNQVE
jgi:hypothetical protein